MDIAHRQIDFDILQAQQSVERVLDELMVKGVVEAVILALHAPARHS